MVFGKRGLAAAIVCCVLMGLGARGGGVQAASVARPVFTAADVFALKGVGEVRISPDGATIAYETADTDIMIDARHHAIRLVDATGSRDRSLAEEGTSPRWSPDGRLITFAQPGAGGGTPLMLATIDGRPARQIALIAGDPSAMVWSPDGQTLAFTMFVADPVGPAAMPVAPPAGAHWSAPPRIVTGVRYEADGQAVFQPGHVQLFTIPVAGGTPRQVTSGSRDVQGDPAWTPDGTRLVYSADELDRLGPGFRVARLYGIAAAGGTATVLSPPDLSAGMPAVSPDGRSIAFVAWAADGRDYSPIRLYVTGIAGGVPRVLEGASDRDMTAPAWAADGRSLYAGYGDRGVDRIGRFPLDGGPATELAENVVGAFTLDRTGAIAFAQGRSDRPADVAFRSTSGDRRILTRRNEALLGNKAVAVARPLIVRSSLDGAPVGAWLTVPPARDRAAAPYRHPLILDIHGGPYGYDTPAWRTRDQLYAAAGYAVLHVNYRGSTSYGFAFADRIAHDPLAPSYADLMSAVDAAIRDGVADPDRLFVTGGSAGGQLTAWIVGTTTRFKAAMAEKPVINALSQALTSDQYVSSEVVAGTKPWDDPMRYWAMSPLSRAARVRTPTMLIVGEQDRRTPVSEAKQFYDVLTLRRIPTALVLVPGASHSTLGSRPSQLVAMTGLTLDWFGRHGGIATGR